MLDGPPFTVGAPPTSGGEVKAHGGPPAPQFGARHAGLGREKGGVQGRVAAPGGGEVMALWCGAALRVLAAGSPRGGRGARPQAEPTPPRYAGSGPWGGGLEGGGRRGGGH